MLIDVAILGDRNAIKKEAQKTPKCKHKGDTSKNRGDWDYFKVI